MDDILEKASELGKMIQQTLIFREYSNTLEAVEKDPESSELMERYNTLVQEFQKRMQAGDIIENFEQEELKTLTTEIETSSLLCDFLSAQKKYIDFLADIQKELNGIKENE